MVTSYRCCCSTVVLIVIISGISAKEEGDQCTTSENTAGKCTLLTECQTVVRNIELFRKFPSSKDRCSFKGTQTIVCCPDAVGENEDVVAVKSLNQSTGVTNSETTSQSEKMCKKYVEYVYRLTESPTLSLIRRMNKVYECPFEREPLIVGGTKAGKKEFPHMVQIGYGNDKEFAWSCGGTLISESFVLTAAHCMWHSNYGLSKKVRGGMTNLKDNEHMQVRDVLEYISHPNFTGNYNDIGLVKVNPNFEPDTYLRPACLHIAQPPIRQERAIATGWGQKKFLGDKSDDLLKVVLEFYQIEPCNASYRRQIIQPGSPIANGIDDVTMVCAGSHDAIKDTCHGDSGGPLQIYHDETDGVKCMYEIVGVTSFGKSCASDKNLPGVYTRVSAYIEWIEGIVWK